MSLIEGHNVLLRTDLNSSVADNRVIIGRRFQEVKDSVKTLFENGAHSVFLFTHQGRKGSSDFIPTREHASILSDSLKKQGIKVEYIGGFPGKYPFTHMFECMISPREKTLYFMENVRFMEEETTYFKKCDTDNIFSKECIDRINSHRFFRTMRKAFTKSKKKFSLLFDGLSVSHRFNHMSIGPFMVFVRSMGYNILLGPQFTRQISELEEFRTQIENKKKIWLFGGSKIKDYLGVMSHILEKDKDSLIMTSGPLSLAFLKAVKKVELGTNESLLKDADDEVISRLASMYSERILLPPTFKVQNKDGMVMEVPFDNIKESYVVDLGKKTLDNYKRIMSEFREGALIGNGSLGWHEAGFNHGTLELYNFLLSKKFVVGVGGGDLTTVFENNLKKKPSFITSSGKAFLTFLVKGELPVQNIRHLMQVTNVRGSVVQLLVRQRTLQPVRTGLFFGKLHLQDFLQQPL